MVATIREPLVFESQSQKLFGVVHRPQTPTPVPAVLILHGFLGSKDQPHRMFVECAEALAASGILALRVDLRGRGDSEGASVDITPQDDLSDAEQAFAALASLPGVDAGRLGVLGMSWGAVLAAMVAGSEPRVKGCVLWSGIPTPALHWSPDFQTIDGREVAENWAMLVGKQFYDGLRDFRPLDTARTARCPFLVIHGTDDDSVPPGDIEQFRTAFPTDQVTVQPIDGGDHIFFRYALKQQVIRQTVDWLAKTL